MTNHITSHPSFAGYVLTLRNPCHICGNIDMQCAPLWDSGTRQFVGLLTVTDFIDVLRYYRRTKGDVSTLATRSISEILSDGDILASVLVRHVPKCDRRDATAVEATPSASHHRTFLSASSETTLKQACRLLHGHSLDFLPVILPDDMRCLATITYTNILEHLVTHFREQRRLFDDTVYDLGIGTYHDDVVTARASETLAEVCIHCTSMGYRPCPSLTTPGR